jgi:hypothetical protein
VPRKKPKEKSGLIVKSEVNLAEEQSLSSTGQSIMMNKALDEKLDVTLLPSVHNMLNSSYSVIANEVQRLDLRSRREQLSQQEIRSFERLTASLVRLASLEMNIREQGELEVMSDDKIMELADQAMRRQLRKARQDGDG